MNSYPMLTADGLKTLTDTLYIRYYNVAFLDILFEWWGLLLLILLTLVFLFVDHLVYGPPGIFTQLYIDHRNCLYVLIS